jgi:hypothetical protein
MLGVMMVHGLQPGPLVMTKNADFIYGIFVALLLANIFCVILQYFGIKLFVRMLAVPKHILLPIIMVLSLVGAIAVNNRIFDAWIVLVFGVVGIVMNRLEFPVTPIILMNNPEIFRWKNGVCELMTGPGLGIDVNEDYVREMAAKGHDWHNPIWRDSDGVIAEW